MADGDAGRRADAAKDTDSATDPGRARHADAQAGGPAGAVTPRRGAALTNLVLASCLAVALGPPVVPAAAGSEQQARVCRSLLLVLNPRDARITIASSRSVGFDDGVTLTYDAEVPGQRPRLRRLTCAFARSQSSMPELIAVSSDGRSLGPARLAFLKRFWLNSQDAAKADRGIAEKH